MRIQNNQPAFNTWTNYTLNINSMQKSMKPLSTGMIGKTDDPAGIGISERMAGKTTQAANKPAAPQDATAQVGSLIDVKA